MSTQKLAALTPVAVLLIEDSPGDVRLTQKAFRDAKKDSHAHAPRPDLIVLDLNLPKMDGRQVACLQEQID